MPTPTPDIPLDLDPPPPVKKKKKSKGGRPKKPAPPPEVHMQPVATARRLPELSEEIFAGMTAGPSGDCCDDCSVDLCMITLIGFCGHPNKGALQASLQNKPEIVARRRFAKRMLDEMVLAARKD